MHRVSSSNHSKVEMMPNFFYCPWRGNIKQALMIYTLKVKIIERLGDA